MSPCVSGGQVESRGSASSVRGMTRVKFVLPDLYAALKRLELSRQVKIKVRSVGQECPTHTSNHGTHTHMAENGRNVLNSLGN